MKRMDALMLPSNWQRVRLGDICEFGNGGAYETLIVENGDFKLISLNSIDIDGNLKNTMKRVNFYDNSLKQDDIVMVLSDVAHGDFLGLCAVIPSNDYVLNQRMGRLRKRNDCINILFLRLYINANQKYFKMQGQGSSQLNLSKKAIEDFEILLPPLNEQIAIANILSDVDRYLYSLDALILKKESVKKALRIKMLNQILASNGVEFRELGDIILSLKTGLNPRSFFKLNTPNANNYYVTIRELEDYTIKFTHQTDRIDDNALSLCLKRSNLEKDDILFSGTGTIGKVSIIEKNPNNWAIKEGIYSIKPNKKIVFPRFLMFCLESSNIQNDIKNKSFGGIVKSIPMNDLQQIQIPLPPLNEQIAIANILSALDHEIISLKNKKRQFENIKKALNHDLMSAKIRVLKK
ncbi:restriction endonuclease subunit S [Helicobacter pylori]|uniref:restriction endonuclease subunit S n=1 Tax=Helicobacter pylori TaxID=210 RepID=UPI0002864468|nr:type I restriction modification DNA specificity domain protein [Helicobacter pylori R037c]